MDSNISAADTASAFRLHFSRFRHVAFSISVLLILVTAAALALGGLVFGLDFTGGTSIGARSDAIFDVATIRSTLGAAGHPDAIIQLSDMGHAVLIRMQDHTGYARDAVRVALGPDARIVSEDAVGPKVSQDLLRSGLTASFGAVSAIAIYVWLRFEARFGISAFLTTLHDVILLVGFYAITGLTFDLTSVAALLLVAGYSINDTVVVFDRLRERLSRHGNMALPDLIDEAISSTLRRTLMTSATTLLTSGALMIFGGPVLFGFAAAITFGIALGTLSSIFVAAPLLLVLPGALSSAEPKPMPGEIS